MDGTLPPEARMGLARRLSRDFMSALSSDVFPAEAYEGVFGVKNDGRDGIGRAVFAAWAALDKLGCVDQEALEAALLAGRLPQLFRESVERQAQDAAAARRHPVLADLVKRGFAAIPWDERLHSVVSGGASRRQAARGPPPAGGAAAPAARPAAPSAPVAPAAPAAPAAAAAAQPAPPAAAAVDSKGLSGKYIVLGGLSKAELNGAVGLCRAFDAAAGRYGVVLLTPPEAARAHPNGLKVRPENLQEAPAAAAAEARAAQRGPAQLGVLLTDGSTFAPQALSRAEAAACAALRDDWRRCPVPALLGVPLALQRVPGGGGDGAGGSLGWQVGVGLLIDPRTGFAPVDVLSSGLPSCLVARTDGKDLSVQELADIHDYTHRLLDSFGDEDFDDAARKEAMSPGAFRRFLAKRGRAA